MFEYENSDFKIEFTLPQFMNVLTVLDLKIKLQSKFQTLKFNIEFILGYECSCRPGFKIKRQSKFQTVKSYSIFILGYECSCRSRFKINI